MLNEAVNLVLKLTPERGKTNAIFSYSKNKNKIKNQ